MTAFNELQWKKFPVLNDGFVCLVDVMGDDASVTQAARVSYGKDVRDENQPVTDPGIDYEEKRKADDRTLIRYLMRHRHTTPFEMAEVKLLVRVPMDCWRQWIRHRTANVNEYSTRYTEAIDSQQTTKPDEWRLQATDNKQGSSGFLPADAGNGSEHTDGNNLSYYEQNFHDHARQLYENRLKAGIAKEQARKDLPLSTYTEAYWKIDLHNLFHFLSLRMDSHAQKEIREYATIIGEQIVKPLFPVCWEAFEDYRLGGMFLTRLDQAVILATCNGMNSSEVEKVAMKIIPNNRERAECLSKLQRLELL